MIYREENIISLGANSDDDDRALPNGQYRELWYCRLGSVDGNAFFIKTSAGTTEITNPLLFNTDVIVGCKEWIEQRKVIYFVWKPSLIHEIWSYDIDAGAHTLLNQDPIWNFQRDKKLFHIVISFNGICGWTDGYWNDIPYTNNGERRFNEPFLINLIKMANGEYQSPLKLQDVQFIKWPFADAPVCVYDTDTMVAGNSLVNKTFRFRSTPIYWNNEEAAYSAYSELVMPNLSEYISGSNWGDSQQDNVIKITVNTGPYTIRKINVAVSVNGANFGVFEQIDKDVLQLADDVLYTFNYYGNAVTVPLALAIRNQDEVPYSADCMELLPTREVAFASYRVGRDKIVLDTEIEPVYLERTWVPETNRLQVQSGVNLLPSPSIYFLALKWETYLEFSLLDGDSFSFVTTTERSLPQQSWTINLTYTITQSVIDQALLLPTVQDQLLYVLQDMAQTFAAEISAITGMSYTALFEPLPFGFWLDSWAIQAPPSPGGPAEAMTFRPMAILNPNGLTPQRRTLAELDHIKGTTYQYGLQYYDEQGRAFTVYTDDSLKMQVPFYTQQEAINQRAVQFQNPNNPYVIDAFISINHLPHKEAAYYRIVRREFNGITNFQEIVVVDISPAPSSNQWRLTIDRQYSQIFAGAGINHQVSKGDILRFIRKKTNDVPSVTSSDNPYNDVFFEVEVGSYDAANKYVFVDRFNPTFIDYTTVGDRGYLVQIYTPQPSLDTDGSLFVSAWKELSPTYLIENAHTQNAYHNGRIVRRGIVLADGNIGDTQVRVSSDFVTSANYRTRITLSNSLGETQTVLTVSSSTVGPGNLFVLAEPLLYDFSIANNGAYAIYGDQQVDLGVSTRAAELPDIKGDVWFRQRYYETGYTGLNSNRFLYWFINDFWYSDYFIQSRINDNGRIAIESPYEKRVYKYASAIHGGKFIDNTLINNLCVFEYIFAANRNIINVKDLDDQYGRIMRIIVDGKTLKCIQEKKENSVYINYSGYVINTDGGEELQPPQGDTFAQWKPYESNFGTMDAGSVVLVPRKGIAYFDRLSGCFILSGAGGQEEISNYIQQDGLGSQNYKYKNRANEITDLCRTYPTETATYVDELNGEIGFGFIHEIEPNQYRAVSVRTPTLPSISIEGNVEDIAVGQLLTMYTSNNTPITVEIITAVFNPLFNRTECIISEPFMEHVTGFFFIEGDFIYSIDTFDYARGQWRTRYDYNFQRFCNLGNLLYGFAANAQLHEHNINSSNMFHGQAAVERIKIVFNQNASLMKRFMRIAIKSTAKWQMDSAITRNNINYQTQSTTLLPSEFTTEAEGVVAARLKRDANSPNFATPDLARINGNEMRGQSLAVALRRDLDGVTITYSVQIMGEISPVNI